MLATRRFRRLVLCKLFPNGWCCRNSIFLEFDSVKQLHFATTNRNSRRCDDAREQVKANMFSVNLRTSAETVDSTVTELTHVGREVQRHQQSNVKETRVITASQRMFVTRNEKHVRTPTRTLENCPSLWER